MHQDDGKFPISLSKQLAEVWLILNNLEIVIYIILNFSSWKLSLDLNFDCWYLYQRAGNLSSVEKLREMGFLILTVTFQYLKWDCDLEGDRLFTWSESDRTRENGFKLKEGWFRLGVMEKLFIQRGVRHWHSLPREAVDVPSLEAFKAKLGKPWATWSSAQLSSLQPCLRHRGCN